MIDFVKIAIQSATVAQWLLNNPLFEFKNKIEELTGNIISFPKIAEHHYLTIIIYESHRIEIEGSLHKYWNSVNGIDSDKPKGVNWNDFSYFDLCKCIDRLCKELNISELEARLNNLEFGLNIITPFNPTLFYRSLIAFKNLAPNKMGNSQIGVKFERDKKKGGQYEIKIYDKGNQYGKKDNILRVELKGTRMEFYHANGCDIFTLADLLKPHIHQRLFSLLLKLFNTLIVEDKIEISQLSSSEKNIYELCRNPRNWESFTPKHRCKYKKKWKEITGQHGQLKWQSITADLLQKKFNELSKSGNDLTGVEKSKRKCFNSSNSMLNHSLLTKQFCKSCGRDISHQKPGSIFCSEKYFGKAAKKCRNMDSNPRNNFRYKITRIERKGVLFDITPYFHVK